MPGQKPIRVITPVQCVCLLRLCSPATQQAPERREISAHLPLMEYRLTLVPLVESTELTGLGRRAIWVSMEQDWELLIPAKAGPTQHIKSITEEAVTTMCCSSSLSQ